MAKTAFDSTYSNVLDNSLLKLNLSRSDLLIPNDLQGDIRYIHPSIKELFDKPLQSVIFADDVVNIFSANIVTLNNQVFTKLNKINHFKNYRAIEFDDFLANNFLNKYLGLDLDSAFGFPASLIVKQYLIPILKANLNLEKDDLFSNVSEIKFIKKYADSIFFREDIPTNNPYIFNEFQKSANNISDKFFKYADLSSGSFVYNTGLSLYLHYLKLNQLTISNLNELSHQIQTKVVETNIGKIAIGGTSNDKFSGNYVLIIDLGGNDTYELPDFPKTLSLLTPIRCIVDFAGNDTYNGGDYTLGGAYFGINIHYDYLGDDHYSAKNTSLGAANFGVGILHDFSGNDSYRSSNFSQGASAYGIGILNDDAGTDTYYSESFSQGFAFTKGVGILIDKIGNDKYTSKGKYSNHFGLEDSPLSFSQGASLGFSPFAAGGFGFLIDLSGSDSYTADSFSQGAAYFFGYGALCDKTGNDSYVSNSFSQGCGLEFSFGNLIDYAGKELYNAKSYSQAYGSDFGSGNLIDFAGDDKYANQSLNPDHTAGNSISFFVDYAGKNLFSSEPKSSNQSASNPIDLLFNYADIKLTDDIDSLNKPINHFADMNFHRRADFRAILPADISGKKPIKEVNLFIFPNSADSLFVLATNNLNNYKKYNSASRDSLATKGFATLEILLDNLNSENPQYTRTVNYVMDKILEINGESTKNYILDSLNSKNHKTFELFSKLLSKFFPLESKPFILFRLLDHDWVIRALAIQALSRYNDKIVSDNLIEMLKDENSVVRARAAAYLGLMKFDKNLANLVPSFFDTANIVRQSAYKGVLSNLSMDAEFVKNVLILGLPSNLKIMIIEDIINTEFKEKEIKEVINLVLDQDFAFRKAFYVAILSKNKSKLHKKIPQLLKNETDSQLKNILKNE